MPPPPKKGSSVIKRPQNESGAWRILWPLFKSTTKEVSFGIYQFHKALLSAAFKRTGREGAFAFMIKSLSLGFRV